MNAAALVRLRTAVLTLAAVVASLILVGCGGGWADQMPTVAIAERVEKKCSSLEHHRRGGPP